jgi:hypothetical protein
MAYCFKQSSRVLVPKCIEGATLRSEVNCFLKELGCVRLGPGPRVSDLSNLGARLNGTLGAVEV